MYTDDYLEQLLKGYGARVPDDCFLLWDERTQGYSVGHFDSAHRPRLLLVDDAALDERLVEFLQSHGVRVLKSLNEVRA